MISVARQAHGRATGIDRPLTIEQMAEDTNVLLRQIGVENVDLFGCSMGSGAVLQIAHLLISPLEQNGN